MKEYKEAYCIVFTYNNEVQHVVIYETPPDINNVLHVCEEVKHDTLIDLGVGVDIGDALVHIMPFSSVLANVDDDMGINLINAYDALMYGDDTCNT